MSTRSQAPPTSDLPLAYWANDVAPRLTAEPAEWGTTAEQAAEFAALTVSYEEALLKATADETRGKLTIADKRRAKSDLLTYARAICGMINRNPNVSDRQRELLGLRPRKPATPGQKPTNKPDLDLLAKDDTSMKIRAHNGDVLVRRIPAGCIGMMVWTHTGPTPPEDYELWSCRGLFTRPTATLQFNNLSGGSKVWVSCCWVNRHGQGPMSDPLEQRMNGPSFAQQVAQQGGEGGMSIAA